MPLKPPSDALGSPNDAPGSPSDAPDTPSDAPGSPRDAPGLCLTKQNKKMWAIQLIQMPFSTLAYPMCCWNM